MTERLYFSDSYLLQFEAMVQQSLTCQGQPAVILDRTAFYPTGGGQPHDLGRLNQTPVIDVIFDPVGETVIHILAAPLAEKQILGQIDWPRRFDHMQQHSGQHILSQALLQIAGAATVGFHLSQTYTTIDIDIDHLTDDTLNRAELLANTIIFENRPVSARFVDRVELATIPLRKPPQVDGPIRIVEVGEFDWSACGGTHVRRCGEIGQIKVVKTERQKRRLRLTFLCGRRALTHYQAINRQMREIALHFSVAVEESLAAIQRQEQALKSLEREKEKLRTELLAYEAQTLRQAAGRAAGLTIVQRCFNNRDLAEVRDLANQLVREPDVVALLGLQSDKGQLIFARSDNLALSMADLLNVVSPLIGGGGGGSPRLAQGGGSKPDRVPAALSAAATKLKQQ